MERGKKRRRGLWQDACTGKLKGTERGEGVGESVLRNQIVQVMRDCWLRFNRVLFASVGHTKMIR